MTFDWWTLGLQTLNFVVLVWVLQRVLYRPVMAIIERRRQETEETFARASRLEAEARKTAEDYQGRLEDLESERRRLAGEVQAELEVWRQRLLAEARAEADRLLAEARERIVAERQGITEEIETNAADLAVALADGLLSEAAGAPVEESFFERLCQRLAAMPERERKRLSGAAINPGVVTVATALSLDEATRTRWRRRLEDLLGPEPTLEFVQDQDLIGGVCLCFPTASLEASWRGALADARREMTGNDAPE